MTANKAGYFFSPLYSDAAFFYQNAGGAEEDDWISQNIYNQRYAGMKTGWNYFRTSAGVYLTVRHRITSRYRYYDRIYDDYMNFGPAYGYISHPRFSMDAGRLLHRMDDEGFLLLSEAKGARISIRPGGIFSGMQISLLHLNLEREEWLRGKKKGVSSVLSGGSIEYEREKFNVNIFGGYYRVFGRPNISDYRYADQPDAVLPTGQGGIYDTGVHYYMLQIKYRASGKISAKFTGIYHEGYQHDMALYSISNSFMKREIKGGLGYISLIYAFNLKQYSDDCSEFHPFLCSVPSIENGPVLGIAALVTSKDRDKRDYKLQGYGPIRSSVNVMGGAASILLNGIFSEFSPFGKYQPGNAFYSGPTEEKEFRDNTDPSLPDYTARLEMTSLRGGFVINKFAFNFFASHAISGDASGNEGIILFSRRFEAKKISAGFMLGAAIADVKYLRKNPGILTDELQNEVHRNYIRYVAGLFFRI